MRPRRLHACLRTCECHILPPRCMSCTASSCHIVLKNTLHLRVLHHRLILQRSSKHWRGAKPTSTDSSGGYPSNEPSQDMQPEAIFPSSYVLHQLPPPHSFLPPSAPLLNQPSSNSTAHGSGPSGVLPQRGMGRASVSVRGLGWLPGDDLMEKVAQAGRRGVAPVGLIQRQAQSWADGEEEEGAAQARRSRRAARQLKQQQEGEGQEQEEEPRSSAAGAGAAAAGGEVRRGSGGSSRPNSQGDRSSMGPSLQAAGPGADPVLDGMAELFESELRSVAGQGPLQLPFHLQEGLDSSSMLTLQQHQQRRQQQQAEWQRQVRQGHASLLLPPSLNAAHYNSLVGQELLSGKGGGRAQVLLATSYSPRPFPTSGLMAGMHMDTATSAAAAAAAGPATSAATPSRPAGLSTVHMDELMHEALTDLYADFLLDDPLEPMDLEFPAVAGLSHEPVLAGVHGQGFSLMDPDAILPSGDALLACELRDERGAGAADGEALIRADATGTAAGLQAKQRQGQQRADDAELWFVPMDKATWGGQQQQMRGSQQQEQGAGAASTAGALYGRWARQGMEGISELGTGPAAGAAAVDGKSHAQQSTATVMAVSQALVMEQQGSVYEAEQEFERLCVKLQVSLPCLPGRACLWCGCGHGARLLVAHGAVGPATWCDACCAVLCCVHCVTRHHTISPHTIPHPIPHLAPPAPHHLPLTTRRAASQRICLQTCCTRWPT
jgi:hypothetical protein